MFHDDSFGFAYTSSSTNMYQRRLASLLLPYSRWAHMYVLHYLRTSCPSRERPQHLPKPPIYSKKNPPVAPQRCPAPLPHRPKSSLAQGWPEFVISPPYLHAEGPSKMHHAASFLLPRAPLSPRIHLFFRPFQPIVLSSRGRSFTMSAPANSTSNGTTDPPPRKLKILMLHGM